MKSYNNNYTKYVGYEGTSQGDVPYEYLWSEQNLLRIQQKITTLLQGLDKDGRPIIVPFNIIGNVMSQVQETHRPQVGNIYSRYILPDSAEQRNDIRDIVDRTIEIVVTQIRNEYEMIEQNKKLTAWNSLLGDFNTQGLRAHAPIKLRKKRPSVFQFHMRY